MLRSLLNTRSSTDSEMHNATILLFKERGFADRNMSNRENANWELGEFGKCSIHKLRIIQCHFMNSFMS